MAIRRVANAEATVCNDVVLPIIGSIRAGRPGPFLRRLHIARKAKVLVPDTELYGRQWPPSSMMPYTDQICLNKQQCLQERTEGACIWNGIGEGLRGDRTLGRAEKRLPSCIVLEDAAAKGRALRLSFWSADDRLVQHVQHTFVVAGCRR